ncbi:hypothetical protein PtB15_13B255 [Puccinia triticina]|nr:hypothetical protein PtB15_13B255 [Puccinia triticina]
MANRLSSLANLARSSMTGSRQSLDHEGGPTQTQDEDHDAQQPPILQEGEEARQAEKGKAKAPKKAIPPTDRATRSSSKTPTGSNTPRDDHTIQEEGPLTDGAPPTAALYQDLLGDKSQKSRAKGTAKAAHLVDHDEIELWNPPQPLTQGAEVQAKVSLMVNRVLAAEAAGNAELALMFFKISENLGKAEPKPDRQHAPLTDPVKRLSERVGALSSSNRPVTTIPTPNPTDNQPGDAIPSIGPVDTMPSGGERKTWDPVTAQDPAKATNQANPGANQKHINNNQARHRQLSRAHSPGD